MKNLDKIPIPEPENEPTPEPVPDLSKQITPKFKLRQKCLNEIITDTKYMNN